MRNGNFVVLLVEDEPADVHLTKMAFNEGQMMVELHDVGDGVEALEFLQHEGVHGDAPRPDLILLDLNMPRMGGRAFLERVKSLDTLRQIPVVVLTTSEAESDIVASYDLGAAGFIVKPVDIEQFIASIRSLEDYWLALVRRPS
ncbi:MULTISPECIES: response regulator [unclassified Halomonas]|uniref:response regulator n=1 Tax=unclassified Halomonas TaxID=2609666 RepID=UPI0020769230|nr:MULTISPECIES: response regulator [unclassified Halomonas]